jgi:Lrp/AsnC family transcriptional regulator
MYDAIDLRLLKELQADSSLSLDVLGQRVALSRNACWRRIKRFEDEGLIKRRVTLLDADKLNVGLTVFLSIRTSQHDTAWLTAFQAAIQTIPEIVAAYRTTGDVDYLLKAALPDVKAYDQLYKRLIAAVPISDVSSFFVMENVKDTTELPLGYVGKV